jgi:hypothetical protein
LVREESLVKLIPEIPSVYVLKVCPALGPSRTTNAFNEQTASVDVTTSVTVVVAVVSKVLVAIVVVAISVIVAVSVV